MRSRRVGTKDQVVVFIHADCFVHGILTNQPELSCCSRVDSPSVAQTNTLVGRMIVATAARRRALRSRVVSPTLPSLGFSALRIPRPSLSTWDPSLSLAPRDQCHGQLYKAITVRVVSRQFDSVRVEQNHCQGLKIVNARVTQASPLSLPYMRSASFHV
jgi:hypothetical protein